MNHIAAILRALFRPASRSTLASATGTTTSVTTEDAEETIQGAAHMQHYGFASRPVDGVEAIVVFRGGQAAGAMVVAEGQDGAPSLAEGEVVVYHRSGAKVHLMANGDIVLEPKAGQSVKLGEAAVASLLKGDLWPALFNTHTHPAVGGSTGAPLPAFHIQAAHKTTKALGE